MNEEKMIEAETIVEIPFHDVDCMRVAWHGHYVKYMEIARCALLDTIDYNYPQMEQTGYVWPVIEVYIRYIKPLRFQQKIRVKAKLVEWENRLKISYLFEDIETGKRLTRGHTVQVAFDAEKEEMMFASPNVLFEKLGIES